MSPKFKVGDKVRVIESALSVGHTGWEDYIEGATVLRVRLDGATLEGQWPYTIKAASGRETVVAECEIELQVKRDYVADHARRTLRKAGLSAHDARRVVQEIQKSATYDLSTFSRRLPAALSEIVFSGFTWEDTVEGEEYWDAVCAAAEQNEGNANA